MKPLSAEASRALAQASPAGFARVASRGQWIAAPHLKLLADRICAVARGEVSRLAVFMPPRHGKSELLSKYTPAWYLGRFPDRRVMVSSYGAALASEWGRKSRDLLEEWGPELFGVGIRDGSKAADRWDIAGRDGGLVAAGVGAALTGRGGHLILIDDPLKNAEEAQSEVIREKQIDWWRSTLRTRLMPGGAVILVLTRWHESDLAGWLLTDMEDGGDQWEVLSLPATCVDPETDPLGRSEGDPLWPEMFDSEDLAKTKRALGPYFWSALYQQTPAPDEGGIFSRSHFRYFSVEGDQALLRLPDGTTQQWAASECRRLTYIDLAASEKTSADYTVLAEVWVTPERQLLVRRITRDRIPGPDQPDFIRAHYAGTIKVESIGYQTTLIQQLQRAGLPVEPVYPDKDKVTRASAAGALYRAGRVYHLAGAEWLGDFELELLAFPAGEHDDQCLVGATEIDTPEGRKRLDQVEAGDLVRGASGWVEVEWAGQTGEAEVLERVGIVGTAGHPVWTDRGWVRLADLSAANDTIWIWTAPSKDARAGRRRAGSASCTTSAGGSTATPATRSLAASSRRSSAASAAAEARSSAISVRSTTPDSVEPGLRSWSRAPLSVGRLRSRSSSTGAPSFGATRTPASHRIGATSSRTARRWLAALRRCIVRFTRTRTARSRPATTSTTLTATSSTTTRPTSKRSPRANIRSTTTRKANPLRTPSALISTASGHSLPPGIARRRAEPGIASTANTSKQSTPVAVFNLKTADGTYFANGVLVHNCDAIAYAARDLADLQLGARRQKRRGHTETGGLLSRDL